MSRRRARCTARYLDEIGYHCRDYFLAQWDRFAKYPGGILAHSTHVKGRGTFDASRSIESPRITVTLATAIPRGHCEHLTLGYLDPREVDLSAWSTDTDSADCMVPRAGELLFRVGTPPDTSGVAT